MRNVNPEKDDSTTDDNSQEQPAEEGINKLEDEKATTDTIKDESRHSEAADSGEDPESKKIE